MVLEKTYSEPKIIQGKQQQMFYSAALFQTNDNHSDHLETDGFNSTHHGGDCAELKSGMVLMQLIEVPFILEQQHGAIPGITNRLAIEDPTHLLQLGPAT